MSQLEPLNSRQLSNMKSALSPMLYKQNRQSKSKLIQYSQLKQLIISHKQIRFYYQLNTRYEYLINKNLKLINKTGFRIGYKIKSNNPQNYQVTPCQQKLQDGENCQIRIKLFLNPQKTNITQYNLDKFLIQWGPLQQITNIPIYNKQFQRILKVQIVVDVNQARNSEIKENIANSEIDIKIQEEILEKNRKKIQYLQEQIQRLQNQPNPWIVSKGMGIFLVIFSFTLGYLIF